LGFLWMQRKEISCIHAELRDALSIPFLGFLWMQHGNQAYLICPRCGACSQFPFWDFFECNGHPSFTELVPRVKEYVSQFPLWDFFECNLKVVWILDYPRL